MEVYWLRLLAVEVFVTTLTEDNSILPTSSYTIPSEALYVIARQKYVIPSPSQQQRFEGTQSLQRFSTSHPQFAPFSTGVPTRHSPASRDAGEYRLLPRLFQVVNLLTYYLSETLYVINGNRHPTKWRMHPITNRTVKNPARTFVAHNYNFGEIMFPPSC